MDEPRSRRRSRRNELLELTVAVRRRRERERKRGRRPAAVVAAVGAVAVAALAGVVVAAAGIVGHALTSCTLAGRTAKPLPQTSFVFAADGVYLGAIYAETYRVPVGYDQVSKWARAATVAAEDRTFWTNDGLNYASIARAAIADLEAGSAVQGASTITQQLVRNLYLSDRKTLARKREEACLALKLAAAWPKTRVLTTYLNRVSYGHRAIGIEAAARTYFGVHASQLGPAQAALLAGLPQAPSAYDPFAHPDAALDRRNEVLRAMRATGSLTAARYRKAVARPLGLHPGYAYTIRRNPNFFAYVRAQLVSVYGEQRVKRGGFKVYTTLDPREQRLARKAVHGILDRETDPSSALVSIDPRTGAIRAMVSIVHGRRLQFNLAAQGRRQTGSAFKTFVLTDAVLHHVNPDTTWYDSAPFTYQPTPQSQPWSPHTYENVFYGPETLTTATLRSDNVVYAKLTLDLGPDSVAAVAHTLGIRSKLQAVPSIGLGSNSVTPLEMASAYATLADGGDYRRPYAIRKVVLPGGRVDSRNAFGPAVPTRVIPTGVAATVTKVLEDNVRSGTGTAAQLPGRDAAGKTGTTSNWTDAWFCGYTPRRTTVVWVGYPHKTTPMTDVHGIHVVGGSFPAQIWQRFMQGALFGKVLPWPSGDWSFTPWSGPLAMSGPPAPTTTATQATTNQPAPKPGKPSHGRHGPGKPR